MNCAYCGNPVNKNIARGCKYVYCNKKCSGLGRRLNKSISQKRKEKSEYDKKYRAKNLEKIKRKKKIYFDKDYKANPEKYREQRKLKYKKHLEYLSTPGYKKCKQEYDEKFRAKKEYGIFWQCALLLKQLEFFLLENRPSGLHFQMGITNKTQKKLFTKCHRLRTSR